MPKTVKVEWCSTEVVIPGISLRDYDKEIGFNVYCAHWLRQQFELTGEGRFSHWHHSANEREGARAGLMAKLMGQARGMPDLMHFGLMVAVELKVGDGDASKDQRAWLEYLAGLGWTCEVVWRFERFREIVLGARIAPRT